MNTGKSSNGKGISLGKKPSNVTRGAGVQVSAHNQMQNAFQAPMSRQKGAASAPSRLDTDTPFEIELSLDPQGGKSAPKLVVVEAATESLENEFISEPVTWVNDLTSHAVPDQSPEEVFKRLLSVMLSYSPDLDLTVNEEEQCIDCVLFTASSFEALRFKLRVFEHNGSTRFELLRHDGAALSMAKLEGELKTMFFGKNSGNSDEKEDVENQEPLSYIDMDLDMDFSGLPPLKMNADGMTPEELDEVQLSLARNDRHCVDDLFDLHSELWKGGKVTALAQDIVEHETLVASLLDTASSTGDIAVIRGCVLILEVLCGDQESALELMQHNSIYKRLGDMLAQKSVLVRNYVVRTLAKLSEGGWNMDSELAKTVSEQVKSYHGEWKNSLTREGLIDEAAFTTIYDKLSQFE